MVEADRWFSAASRRYQASRRSRSRCGAPTRPAVDGAGRSPPCPRLVRCGGPPASGLRARAGPPRRNRRGPGGSGGRHRPPSAAGARLRRSRLRDTTRPHPGRRRPHGGGETWRGRAETRTRNCSHVTRMRSPIMPPSSGSRSEAIPTERCGSHGRTSHSARPRVPTRSCAGRAATRRASRNVRSR